MRFGFRTHGWDLGAFAPRHRCSSFAWRGDERSRFHLLRRLPEPLEIIELARMLGENVYHEINIIQQHPLRLAVSFHMRWRQPRLLQTLFHLVGNGLDL